MQFADKTTLGQSAILGLVQPPGHPDEGVISQSQLNWLGTIFYLFFLGFEWPQNLALQYFPVGKWMRCVAATRSLEDFDTRVSTTLLASTFLCGR